MCLPCFKNKIFMIILDGKKLSLKILEGLKEEIETRRLKLKLAVILVGDNFASKVFIRQKEKACRFAGIDFELFSFFSDIRSEELKKEIKKIVANPASSGIIIQLPLPEKLNLQEILNLVPAKKDIDVLCEENLGKFYGGTLSIFPPVVGAIKHFLEEYEINTKGKHVVLVGAGALVGFPSALWFFRKNATVSVINEFTKDISWITKRADIIVSGVGKPGLIKGDMVKDGAAVIDVGFGFENGKISGDIDFKTVSKKASFVTPVPGGVGPMTVACLLENLVKLNVSS